MLLFSGSLLYLFVPKESRDDAPKGVESLAASTPIHLASENASIIMKDGKIMFSDKANVPTAGSILDGPNLQPKLLEVNLPVNPETGTETETKPEIKEETVSKTETRIFFIALLKGADGKIQKEIMSISEDGKDPRFHGKVRDGETITLQPVSHNETKKFAFGSSRNGNSARSYLHDWSSSEINETPLFDSTSSIPCFSRDGKRMIFKSVKDKECNLTVFKMDDQNFENVRSLSSKDMIFTPKYSFDEKSVIYAKIEIGSPSKYYKLKLDGTEEPKLIGIAKAPAKFLVSPTEEKLFKINSLKNNSTVTTEFVLIGTEDTEDNEMKPEQIIHTIEKCESIFELLSYSSNGEFVYMSERHADKSSSVIKMNIRNGEMEEVFSLNRLESAN